MKIKFNSDDYLPLIKTLEIYNMIIVVRSVSIETTSITHKYYTQVLLTSITHKYYPQVLPTSITHKYYPQVLPTSFLR